jgi:hypothetical protein
MGTDIGRIAGTMIVAIVELLQLCPAGEAEPSPRTGPPPGPPVELGGRGIRGRNADRATCLVLNVKLAF